ncbi:MAG TPA: fatty acid desaturase [Gammaproteobacteria bacterium]|nr:fatty acid desaturase [Gammaproteobacteria bacterium]
MASFMRQPRGYWPHLAALAYGVFGYGAGVALLTVPGALANGLGVLLLAHALVICAYLVHDCAHNTVFRDGAHNARLGRALNWITGACYGDYQAIRHKHFRHHVDRADVVAFDYRPLLARHPLLLRVILALEWAYIPALDLFMHALVLMLPFALSSRHGARRRVLGVALVRIALFGVLGMYAPKGLLLYALAYLLFLHVMRFMDAFQHTYEVFETLEHDRGPEAKRFDRDYEHRNTFSNPVSLRHPWLNLLTLNFGYHNAHHARPTAPWYRLPALHRELYGDDDGQVIPFANQLRSYHRHRVARVLNGVDMDIGAGSRKGLPFVGVVGVSFLTAH